MNIAKLMIEGSMPSAPCCNIFGVGGDASKTDRNKQLDAWGTLAGTSHFGTDAGKTNVTQGSKFFSDILSGDQKKIGAAIAPMTKVIQGQAQQQKNQMAEFGNRSGGTNASNQMIDTNAKSEVQNLINTLIPQAASNLEQTGMQELTLGTNAASTLGDQAEKAREFDKQNENAMGSGLFSIFKPILKAGAGFIPGVGPLLAKGLA